MLEINKIHQGDCLELMKTIPDKSINMILCDLPYGISRHSGFSSGKLKKFNVITQQFGKWDKKDIDLKLLSKESFRILKDGGVCVLFYDIWDSKTIKTAFNNFKQPRILIWTKTNPVPINSKINLLSNAQEFAFSFVKKRKPIFNTKYHNCNFNYPICHGKERTNHTTQKPLKLFEDIIKIYSNKDGLVLDMCMGSGTTAIACLNTGRNYIGIELDKEYFEIAKKRIEEHSQQSTLLPLAENSKEDGLVGILPKRL